MRLIMDGIEGRADTDATWDPGHRVAGRWRNTAMDDAAVVRDLVTEMESLFRTARDRRDAGRVRAIKAGLILLMHLNEHGFVKACGITNSQAARCREYARAWACAGSPGGVDEPTLPDGWAEVSEDDVRTRGRDPERLKYSPSRAKFDGVPGDSEADSGCEGPAKQGFAEEAPIQAHRDVPVQDSPGSPADPDCARTATLDLILGDCKLALPTVTTKAALIVTSPPYADRRDGGVHPDEYVEWFLARADLLKDALVENGTLIVNIKEHVVDGERHTYVIDLIKAMRSRGWLWTEEWCWSKANSTPGRWPNRFRDGWERMLQFNLRRDFAMYQDAVRQPIGDWAATRHRTVFAGDDERRASTTGSGFAARRAHWVGKESVLPDNVIDADDGQSVAERIVSRLPPEQVEQILRDLAAEGVEVSNVLRAPTVCHDSGHSAAFPVAIPDFFIRLFTRLGDVVLDPFCGSGTTGEAALLLGRSFVGIDIDERAIGVARTRIEGAAARAAKARSAA